MEDGLQSPGCWAWHLYLVYDYINCTPIVLLNKTMHITCATCSPAYKFLTPSSFFCTDWLKTPDLCHRWGEKSLLITLPCIFHRFPFYFIIWKPDGALEVHLTFSRRWVMRGERGFGGGTPVCHLSHSVVSLKLINAAYVPHLKRAPKAGSSQRCQPQNTNTSISVCTHKMHTHLK